MIANYPVRGRWNVAASFVERHVVEVLVKLVEPEVVLLRQKLLHGATTAKPLNSSNR